MSKCPYGSIPGSLACNLHRILGMETSVGEWWRKREILRLERDSNPHTPCHSSKSVMVTQLQIWDHISWKWTVSWQPGENNSPAAFVNGVPMWQTLTWQYRYRLPSILYPPGKVNNWSVIGHSPKLGTKSGHGILPSNSKKHTQKPLQKYQNLCNLGFAFHSC